MSGLIRPFPWQALRRAGLFCRRRSLCQEKAGEPSQAWLCRAEGFLERPLPRASLATCAALVSAAPSLAPTPRVPRAPEPSSTPAPASSVSPDTSSPGCAPPKTWACRALGPRGKPRDTAPGSATSGVPWAGARAPGRRGTQRSAAQGTGAGAKAASWGFAPFPYRSLGLEQAAWCFAARDKLEHVQCRCSSISSPLRPPTAMGRRTRGKNDEKQQTKHDNCKKDGAK